MMAWSTGWALAIGFILSGIVQEFIPKRTMQDQLGNHSPLSVLRASLYGMVSSSCSYAASAMSKSLFARGADLVSSLIFMIASTNLVVELGIALLVLMGWQFLVAEFIGGPVMIFLIALVGGWVFRRVQVGPLRARLETGASGGDGNHASFKKLSSWANAAGFAVGDVTMLRKELTAGFLVGGMLQEFVPGNWWRILFFHGHGIWTVVENALVGPLIAVISFVCSIGNVPLAVTLWRGGIGFGGVVAFLFADLITVPLLLIYRRYYGNAVTVRIFGLFYFAMAIAGIVTELVFKSFGHDPRATSLPVVATHPILDYSFYLNAAAVVLALVTWWLAKKRTVGSGVAVDPVCGMQVRTSDAAAFSTYEVVTYYFCSERCERRFTESPKKFLEMDSSLRSMDEPEPQQIQLGRKPTSE
jgi:uncharacterized membrane protein YraQ (UPF0718 family)